MAIKIITDSAADYTEAECNKRGILCVPMSVTFGERTYLDGVNLTKQEFYEKLALEFPKTSQPSPAEFLEIFEEAKEKKDTVIAILLSGSLSGTLQSAFLAKDMVDYEDIHILDSCTATLGMRILVDQAVRMAGQGSTAEEIMQALEALKSRITIYAGLDTLKYLAKGGRLPQGAAALGNLIDLKPVITLSPQGEVVLAAKSIGVLRACKAAAGYVSEHQPDRHYPIYFIYSGDRKNCLRFVQYLGKNGMEFEEHKFREIGPTIGSHIGTGAFGIVYVRQETE